MTSMIGLPELQQSKLLEFFTAYLQWLDKGAPDNQPFLRGTGLCTNASLYCKNGAADHYLTLLLHNDFKKAMFYPFGRRETALQEVKERTAHLNQERINWVRQQLEKYHGND